MIEVTLLGGLDMAAMAAAELIIEPSGIINNIVMVNYMEKTDLFLSALTLFHHPLVRITSPEFAARSGHGITQRICRVTVRIVAKYF